MSDRETLLVSAARDYLSRGWTPIRLKPREKIPPGKHDTNKLTIANIEGMLSGGDYNIGVMLGAESGGLVDLDLDWPEARTVAEVMFPRYPSFGRRSAPQSHRLTRCVDAGKAIKFALPSGVKDARLPSEHVLTVMEVRTNGLTMFPPSIHPCGENVEWSADRELETVSWTDLVRRAGTAAFISAAIRFWPQQGTRDETAMALAGALLTTGLDADTVDKMTRFVAKTAGDDEWERRAKAKATADKMAAGEACTGLTRFVELLGLPESCCKTFRDWLGQRESSNVLDAPRPKKSPGNVLVLDLSAPLACARQFIEHRYSCAGDRTLVLHRGEYFVYADGIYRKLERDALIAALYAFMEEAVVDAGKTFEPCKPKKSNVEQIEHAMRGLVLVEEGVLEPPAWIAGEGPEPKELLVCRNGLLHMPTGKLMALTPRLFTLNGVGIDYEPSSPPPERWLQFLDEVFPGDAEAIATLQEIIGYFLTPETQHQKAFMLIAPPRSGKGTIARVIEELVGKRNYAGIKLKQLGDDFGLQSLIGKLVAVVTDARVGAKVDRGALVETILNVSGEDTQNINRKNLPYWTGKLPVRFFVHTNELPRLEDMSGALASRFILLTTEVSFLGREDHTLGDRLRDERPGILLWAIEGYRRLRQRGRFVQPKSAERMLRLFQNIASPVTAFVGEMCELDPDRTIAKDDLYQAYCRWFEEQGRRHAPTKDTFSANLYAAFPSVCEIRVRAGAHRAYHYKGICMATVGSRPDRSGEGELPLSLPPHIPPGGEDADGLSDIPF